MPQPARVWIVRQLEHLGAAESVPTLTKLLIEPDAELREVARRALEKNSAPMASVSLQAALRKGGRPEGSYLTFGEGIKKHLGNWFRKFNRRPPAPGRQPE